MAALLSRILSAKRREISDREKKVPLGQLQEQARACRRRCRPFIAALASDDWPAVIGELKRASPVKGWLNQRLSLAQTARLYQRNGVRALSVLTDRHFKGRLSDIAAVKAACLLPVLRKDFIISEYQVYESYLAGADAILLIVAALPPAKLRALAALARGFGLATIAEAHTRSQLRSIAAAEVDFIGINNRNLKTFRVDINVTARLMPLVPARAKVISESGIHTRQDVAFLRRAGVSAVLVGESIVTAPDIVVKVRELTRAAG